MQPAAFSWLRGEIHVDVVVGVVLLTGAYTWANDTFDGFINGDEPLMYSATITAVTWGGQFVVGKSALDRVNAFPLSTVRYAGAAGLWLIVRCTI